MINICLITKNKYFAHIAILFIYCIVYFALRNFAPMPRGHIMENTEQTTEVSTTKTISVELTSEQYAFLTKWQKTHEQELGIEIPVGAMVRKAVDAAMKAQNTKEDRPPRRDDRPAGRSFGGKPSFGGRDSAPRRSFGDRSGGDRPSRGPKFNSFSGKPRTRTFDN